MSGDVVERPWVVPGLGIVGYEQQLPEELQWKEKDVHVPAQD